MKALIYRWSKVVNPQFLLAPICLVLASTIFCAMEQRFASVANMGNIAGQAALLLLLSAGQMAVMVNRGFDISVGAVAALSSTVSAIAVNQFGTSGLALGLIVGSLFGLLNGVLVAYLSVQPVIATLSSLLAAKAVALLVSYDGQAIIVTSDATLSVIAHTSWMGAPPSFWIAVTGMVALGLLLNHTAMGRRLFLCGSNPQAARLIGVSVARSTCLAYLVCGSIAGLGGVILLSRSGAGLPTEGAGLELQSIVAALIGGTALAGGSGSLIATACGVLFIQVVLTGLNLTGVSPFVAQILFGMLIVGSGFLDKVTQRFFNR